MNAPESFSKEQQAYLQGLLIGNDVARTVRNLPVLSGALGNATLRNGSVSIQVGEPEAIPSHLPPLHLEALQKCERNGKVLVPEEKAKRDKDGLEMWGEIGERCRRGEFPKGTDIFLTKYYGLFFVAPAQNAYMCRMRIPGGFLRSEQLSGVAKIADECANGSVDITTRANLQLREIPAHQGMEVLMQLRDLGIVTRGAGADNVRNVTCSTLSGIDPIELAETYPLARELHYHILHKRELYGLPRKFNIAFDGSGQVSSLAETNDISWHAVRVKPSTESTQSGINFLLGLGGITGHGDFARSTSVVAPASDCIGISEAILRVFIRHGDRTDRKKARLKYLLDAWGFERFLNEVEQEWGRPLIRVLEEHFEKPDQVDRWAHVDVHSQKQSGFSYVGVVCPVGKLTSDQCRALSKIASTFGDGTLQLTVWQNLIIPHIANENVPAVLRGIEAMGLEWRSSSVRAGLVACTGSAGCKFAGADTKRDAMYLANYLDCHFDLDGPINIHFTGCLHSCAQHAIGDIGLIATKVEAGEDLVDGYHILVGGRTGIDSAIGVKLCESIVSDQVPMFVASILEHYLENREERDLR